MSGQPSIAFFRLLVWKYIPTREFVRQKGIFVKTPNGDPGTEKGTKKVPKMKFLVDEF